jgi:hypothetical protein
MINKGYTVKYFGAGFDSSKPVFIGIDQSYLGFAITFMNKDGNYHTAVAKASGTGVERLYNLQKFLDENLVADYNYSDFVMEGYAFGSQMANMLGELGGMVKLHIFDTFGIRALLVPPTNLKKYVTGKGTGVQKNQMLLHIYKKWNVEFTDDNAADSYALARIAAKLGDTQYEKDTLEKLDDIKFRA